MIEHILNVPLYLYSGTVVIWWFLGEVVPHYSWAEYGSLLKGFLWLIPARVAYGVLFPEKVVIKRFKNGFKAQRASTIKPSKTDHQSASAVMFDVFKN